MVYARLYLALDLPSGTGIRSRARNALDNGSTARDGIGFSS